MNCVAQYKLISARVFDKISHALYFEGMKEKFGNVNKCMIMVHVLEYRY